VEGGSEGGREGRKNVILLSSFICLDLARYGWKKKKKKK
jgi:hypothetical protein